VQEGDYLPSQVNDHIHASTLFFLGGGPLSPAQHGGGTPSGTRRHHHETTGNHEQARPVVSIGTRCDALECWKPVLSPPAGALRCRKPDWATRRGARSSMRPSTLNPQPSTLCASPDIRWYTMRQRSFHPAAMECHGMPWQAPKLRCKADTQP